jgi:hypothetical protein
MPPVTVFACANAHWCRSNVTEQYSSPRDAQAVAPQMGILRAEQAADMRLQCRQNQGIHFEFNQAGIRTVYRGTQRVSVSVWLADHGRTQEIDTMGERSDRPHRATITEKSPLQSPKPSLT